MEREEKYSRIINDYCSLSYLFDDIGLGLAYINNDANTHSFTYEVNNSNTQGQTKK
jgi:hypothetical protein